MWTRKDIKARAKASFKLNYWKTVLIALLLAAVTGGFAGGAGAASGAASGASAARRYSYDATSVTYSQELTDEQVEEIFGGQLTELTDPNMSVEELMEHTEVIMPSDAENSFPVELIPVIVAAASSILLVAIAIVLVVNAFLLNPLVVGARRFFLRNLNQPAMAAEAGYGFDNNYKETVKTMFFRDLYVFLWSLLFIIPGIVKALEYRMVPYLLADDPTMTKERAFAESRAMMHGNKWKAFVLDLSFLGWSLLSALTLGIVGVFYVDPYIAMTDAALYESLRYGTPAPALAGGYGEPVPVAPFAAQDGFAAGGPQA